MANDLKQTDTMVSKQRITLETVYNARDLGGYRTEDGFVTTDRFIRTDCFVPMCESDRQALIGLDVRTVIDLRNQSEREKIPSGLADDTNVTYICQPIYPEPTGQNDRQDWSKMSSDFTMAALYIDMLDHHCDAIRDFFHCAASARQGRILFHCSAGKDRTGLLAALLLKLAGVCDEAVVADYALTEIFLADVMPALKENSGIPAMMDGVVDEMLGSRPANMELLLERLYAKYGDAVSYLRAIDVCERDIACIKDSMTEK